MYFSVWKTSPIRRFLSNRVGQVLKADIRCLFLLTLWWDCCTFECKEPPVWLREVWVDHLQLHITVVLQRSRAQRSDPWMVWSTPSWNDPVCIFSFILKYVTDHQHLWLHIWLIAIAFVSEASGPDRGRCLYLTTTVSGSNVVSRAHKLK